MSYWSSESKSDEWTSSFESAIENALLQNFDDGRATLGELKDNLQQYSLFELHLFCEDDDIVCLFDKQKKRDSIVILLDKDAKLCHQYNTRRGCQKRNCNYFHLCRDYVDYKSCTRQNCSSSHDVGDEHNVYVARRINLMKYNCRERLILVRSSNPKVCLDYNSPKGCRNNEPGSCPDIHICSDKILKKCSRGPERCRYNHDIFECSQTLGMYISMKNSEELLERVILVLKGGNEVQHYVQANRNPSKQRRRPPQEKRRRASESGLSFEVVEPDEDKVFDNLIKTHHGMGTVLDVSSQCRELSHLSIDKATEWLKQHDRFLVFQHTSQLKLSRVVAYTKSLRLCFARDCRNDACKFLHVCRNFIAGNCASVRCRFSHNLRDEHNDQVVRGAGFAADVYDEENILDLVRCSLLKCCAEYNKNNFCADQLNGTCPHLHVCSQFILGKCPNSDTNCKYGHNLASVTCMETLIHYKMERLPEKTAKRMVLVTNSSPTKETLPTDRSKDTWICEPHLRNACSKGARCPHHHFELPYLWQVKVDGQWNDLLTNNCEIEQAYSNAAMSTVHISGEKGTLDFETLQLNREKEKKESPVRRLSTISYVQGSKDGQFTTCWLWYWKDEFHQWNEYSADNSPPYQDVIEGSFQKGLKELAFKFGKQNYILNLEKGNLMQTNVVYGTQRPVRRRPTLIGRSDIKTKHLPQRLHRQYNQELLPADWMPMDTQTPEVYEKVELPKTSQVFKSTVSAFQKTMKSDFKIRKIFKIQNLTHWTSYQRKKETMTALYKGNASQVDEKQLFHGTDDQTVECICRQNFDPRVHGKNAVVYGKGAYFARDAVYSNSYADNSRVRYMFYAKVLTGKKIVGNQAMQRPPPVDARKPAGELYGSCVNDARNPAVFVIFDRDQCYPECLIEYEVAEYANQEYYYQSLLNLTTSAKLAVPSAPASTKPLKTVQRISHVQSGATSSLGKPLKQQAPIKNTSGTSGVTFSTPVSSTRPSTTHTSGGTSSTPVSSTHHSATHRSGSTFSTPVSSTQHSATYTSGSTFSTPVSSTRPSATHTSGGTSSTPVSSTHQSTTFSTPVSSTQQSTTFSIPVSSTQHSATLTSTAQQNSTRRMAPPRPVYPPTTVEPGGSSASANTSSVTSQSSIERAVEADVALFLKPVQKPKNKEKNCAVM